MPFKSGDNSFSTKFILGLKGIFLFFLVAKKQVRWHHVFLFIFLKHITKPIFSQSISKFYLIELFLCTLMCFFMNKPTKIRQFSTTHSLKNSTVTHTFYYIFEKCIGKSSFCQIIRKFCLKKHLLVIYLKHNLLSGN